MQQSMATPVALVSPNGEAPVDQRAAAAGGADGATFISEGDSSEQNSPDPYDLLLCFLSIHHTA
jgi:hypothetical protein